MPLSCPPYEVTGFDLLPDSYAADPFFSKVLQDLNDGKSKDYLLINGYLFEGNQLCLSEGSWRLFFIEEFHVGRLGGHLDEIRLKLL